MRAFHPCNQTFEPQLPQVVAHLAGRIGLGHDTPQGLRNGTQPGVPEPFRLGGFGA